MFGSEPDRQRGWTGAWGRFTPALIAGAPLVAMALIACDLLGSGESAALELFLLTGLGGLAFAVLLRWKPALLDGSAPRDTGLLGWQGFGAVGGLGGFLG